MIKRNSNYTNLAKGYLFPEIAKRRREYQAAHPDAKIISLGIGNTTEPLTPHIVEEMKKFMENKKMEEISAKHLNNVRQRAVIELRN